MTQVKRWGGNMEDNGYAQFNTPYQDFNGTWLIRSPEKYIDGFTRFLASQAPSRPYVGTVANTSCDFIFDTEKLAHQELAYYYSYHHADYPYQERLDELLGNGSKTNSTIESQKMRFE